MRIGVITAAALALAACGGERSDRAASSSGSESAAATASGGAVAIPAGATKCAADNGGLTLPAGFCATVFADGLGSARHLAVAPNGDVFAAIQAARGGQGAAGIVALRDADGDGVAEKTERFGPSGATGIGLYDGHLYQELRGGSTIVRWPLAAGSLTVAAGAKADTIVTGLPTGGHNSRNFAIGRDGALYVNVGSNTNSCQQKDRQNESAGNDPCTELETRAGIWKFDARKTGQAFSPAARYATGIRNAVGLTIAPDGKLWSTQHGRDQLVQNWGKKVPRFTEAYSAENPAELLLQIDQGNDFGWPYCYESRELKKAVTAPEYGGDGADASRCGDKKRPVATFPGHWAPNALAFYTGSRFPAKYRGGAFIAFHGSWNRPDNDHGGYNVTFVPLRNGQAAGSYEVFADGFAGGSKNPSSAAHRPSGLAVGPDGALYVGDDKGGRIYKIVYTGR